VAIKTTASQLEEFRGGRKVPVRPAGIDVAEIGRQKREQSPRVATIAVAVKEGAYGESMTIIPRAG